ncbi:MAG TPA: hypothetical protein VF069_03280 [Streptosporangiaceae bacterium]
MQPMTGAPPVPGGAVALDAWRELDRRTRRELLRGGRPHPDPAIAVVAVGYARTMLARSAMRQRLPLTAAMAALVMTLAVLFALLDSNDTVIISTGVFNVLPAVLVVPFVVAARLRLRNRIVALHRMEAVNAARLWSTERTAPVPDRPLPQPPPSGAGPSHQVVIRYSRRFLLRSIAIFVAFVAVIETAVVWAEGGVLALFVTALLAVAVGLTVYNVVARTRPWLPMVIMDRAGMELPSMGARLAWAQITELRIHPYRAGRSGRKGRHHAVAFVLADPEAFRVQLAGWWAKKTRTPLSVYGTPLVIADLALDRSAEQIAGAAAMFTTAPIRRFGP